MENYEIHSKLGSGNYAKVYLATDLDTNEKVALKLVDKKEMRHVLKASRRMHAEMANMKKLGSHDNIVSLYETFETTKYYVIAMEYMSGGELFDYVQKKEGMGESNAREMFTGIVQGVQHCHNNGIAHRDLKLENILLDEANKPKLADFGFSKGITTFSTTASSVGSMLYSSPEIIQGNPYRGPECDVWSLGVILYTMLTATMPFDDSNLGEFMLKIANGEYPEPIGVSDASKNLIRNMLNPNPSARFTLQEVLSHPWMTNPGKSAHRPSSRYTKRRTGVSYTDNSCVHQALLKLNQCDCSCHRSRGDTDFTFMRHCKDCEEVQSNDPEIMLRRQIRLSRNSSISSGYGSEFGNPFVYVPQEDMRFLGVPVHGRRSSVPRKSTASTCTGMRGKNQRQSMPPNILTPNNLLSECVSNDEDIVFV